MEEIDTVPEAIRNDVDTITNGTEHEEKPVVSSDSPSPTVSSREFDTNQRSDDSCQNMEDEMAVDGQEPPNAETDPVEETKLDKDDRQEEDISSDFAASIPKPKKTQKKTLTELHEQLLKKLDPNLIPPAATSLSEIFRNGTSENDIPKDQENGKDSSGAPCENPKLTDTRDSSSNGMAKSLGNGSRPVEKGLYRCMVADCRCSFTRLNDLNTHFVGEHPDLKSYPCSFCFREFEGLEPMTEHLKLHIKNVFKCSHCQMASDSKDALLNHISKEHPDLPKKITIYVKILNNDRQKRAALIARSSSANNGSNQNPNPSTKERGEVVVSADKSPKDTPSLSGVGESSANSEVARSSRSSRKSSKPVKCQREVVDDVVCIYSAERIVTVPCSRCSFVCDSQHHLKSHQFEGHVDQNISGLLKCKICKFSTDTRLSFQNHMVHHKGQNVIRYYICPYCGIDTNSMDVVEEHVLDRHPSQAFRFEVLQETAEFLKDLLECPVCRGSFLWRDEFVDHVRSVHCLDELSEHLLESFPESSPVGSHVPKSFFRNLLPETADFEETPQVEQMVVSSDEENSGITNVDQEKNVESLNEETSICVQQNTKDKEKVFQFNCHTCNYTSCDYDKYMAHFKTHTSEKSESLIKKLLTKSVVPPYTSGQSNDLELDLNSFRRSTQDSSITGQKSRGAFHCNLCPFTCTKTVHFKRHMAIHARNETLKEGYKCGYCQFAHYRLNCVKFHLGKYHGNYPNKMIRIMDGIEIELGAEDDPGKARRSLSSSKASAPFLRTASEKRPTIRYEEARMPNLQRTSGVATVSHSTSGSGNSSQDMSLAEFELQLPAMMIYPEPVKCIKCDFTNRVRINLIRHLKLHREDADMKFESAYSSPSSSFLKESSELRALMIDDVARPSTLGTNKRETPPSITATSKRNLILDEKPLLRSILCEKPVTPKLEREGDESDSSNSEMLVPSKDRNLGTIPRSNTSSDYSDYSVRLHGSDLYRCKECSFVNRFPSKVKRHYSYKHVNAFPYKCGYCSFEAVESGKVRRHCHQVHRMQPVRIIRSEIPVVKKDKNVVVEAIPEIEDEVVIVDEVISGDSSEGQGDQWLAQFVIKVDSNLQCCKLCGYQQEGATSLQHHVYTNHLKLYPFSCKYCGVALTEIDRVKRHIEKHHLGLPLVVVRRHFEDSPPDGSLAENEKVSSRTSLKSEPVEIDEEEAPQLDFYPKSNDLDTFSNSIDWNDDDDDDNDDSNNTSDDDDDKMPSFFRESNRENADQEDDFESVGVGNHRKLFKCVYCGIISKWNRRDIRLHIMHVHLRRRVYTCRHCSFGNSKSKAVVKSHCAKFHPNKPVSVRDDIDLFNSVIPIEDKNGIVTMAFSNASGVPVLDIDELENNESGKATSKSELQKPPILLKNRPIKVEVSEPETNSSGREKTLRQLVSAQGVTKKSEIPLDLSSRKLPLVTNSHGRRADQAPSVSVPTPPKAESTVVRRRTEWRCKLCNFVNQNASHVKYHLICYHLKLKPFSCPHCQLYIWKSQGVLNHIEKQHPGKEKKIFATVEEKAVYITQNMEKVAPDSGDSNKDRIVAKESVQNESANDNNSASGQQKTAYFRCGICGYQDARNDKTKYHIIKQHLKLRQFSCPHCHLYMWGRQQVAKHVEEEHPGMEISVTRTFQEYEDFLKQTITRVTKVTGQSSGSSSSVEEDEVDQDGSSDFQNTPSSSSPLPLPVPPPSLLQLRCNKCSFVTDSEMSLSAHKRSHRMFQCFHCDFRHMLAAKVQIHCLAKHPNKLVKYKQCDTSLVDSSDSSSSANVARSTQNSWQNEKPASEKKSVKVFHPCDECPSHFNTASELEQHVSSEHDEGMYVCNYCHIVMWNRRGIDDHLRQVHPDKRPNFKVVKKELGDPRKRKHSSDSSDEGEFSARKVPNLEKSNGESSQALNKKPTTGSDQTQYDTVSDNLAAYRCRLCNYRSGKVTVMRHHAMSHLRYHPYLCPYCDVVRSVKSFPITKHVRSKHPNCELKFFYARDEVMETQVKNSYYRVQSQPKSSSGHEEAVDDDCGEPGVPEIPIATSTESASTVRSMLPRKVLYKCMFCGLKTHIRTDMKHHLMREIQYKPFRCVYCPYTEPCKWSMRKHFRTKHGGIEVEVEEIRDSDSDARVEKLLEKCTVLLKRTTDPELLAWRPSSTPQRRVYGVPEAGSKPKVTLNPKPVFSASLLKRPFKSTKSMAIKFHRCPHCAYTNTSLKLVRGHMVKHGPFRLQCGYCDYRGHYPSRIRKHLRRHHPGLPFKCTKVALPQKDQNAEQIPVIHVPRVAVKTQNKPAPGTVFLDGVPVDIPLIPDSQGWYRCLQCDYQSINREHFKMHAVIHRPPKWRCFYCDQKYPVIFRLRRHSNSKHPNLPIKWVEVETGKVSVDAQKPASGVNNSGGSRSHQRLHSTARKSTSKGARSRDLALGSGQRFLSKSHRDSLVLSSDSDLTIVDEPAFVIGEPFSLVQDVSDSESDFPVDFEESSGVVNLCCHLCSFSTLDRVEFGHHFNSSHSELSNSIAIEILPGVEDCDEFALRRCGFCHYETYAGQEFSAHVQTHTSDTPSQCSYCSFASFSRDTIKYHIESDHPGFEVRFQPLKEQYTMSNDVSMHQKQQLENGLDTIVVLQDIMKMTDLEFESIISAFGVSFERVLDSDKFETNELFESFQEVDDEL